MIMYDNEDDDDDDDDDDVTFKVEVRVSYKCSINALNDRTGYVQCTGSYHGYTCIQSGPKSKLLYCGL